MIHNHGIGWEPSHVAPLTIRFSAQWDAEDGDAEALGYLLGMLLLTVDDPIDYIVKWTIGPTKYVKEVRGKVQRSGSVMIHALASDCLEGGRMHRMKAGALWRRASIVWEHANRK